MKSLIFFLLNFYPLTVLGYHILRSEQSARVVELGGALRLVCTSNEYFEYCTWTHAGERQCDMEWKMMKGKVIIQECHSELKHRVSVTGDYNSHECGIEIEGFEAKDAGNWTCEMEEYYKFGGRGSGPTDSHTLTVGLLNPTTTTTSSTTALVTSTQTSTTTESTTPSTTPPSPPSTTQTTPPSTTQTPGPSSTEARTEEIEILSTPAEPDTEDTTRETAGQAIIDTRIEDSSQESDNDTEVEDPAMAKELVQLDDEELTSGSTIGLVCGVLAGVLGAAGLLAGFLVWRRRKCSVRTITMSKLIEEGEVRGTLLEENEFNSNVPEAREEVDRVLINSLP